MYVCMVCMYVDLRTYFIAGASDLDDRIGSMTRNGQRLKAGRADGGPESFT